MTGEITIAQARVALRDPQDCTDQADDLALLEALFDALVRRGPDGRFAPALAESWTVSPDARTWTFRLRPDLRFHNGDPVDAEAAAFSIRRMQRPEIGATLGAPAVWGQYLGGAEIEAHDALTIGVNLTAPTADLLDVLVSGYVLPPALADDPDFLTRPVGSGAYKATAVADGEIRMAVNSDWHGGALPYAGLRWLETPHGEDRAAAVATGAAQVATRLEPGTPGAVAHVDPVAIIFLLNAGRPAFADARVRRALNLAVDRPALIETILGGAGAPLNGFVSDAHFGADAGAGPLFDPAEARRLLAAAGHADGLTIEVDRPTRLPDEAAALTDAVAAQLAEIGVACDIRVHTDRTAYAEAVRDKRIGDMCLFDSSPMSAFRVINEKLDSRWRGSWWQGYANTEVETLLDRARRQPDDDLREDVYRQAYRALRDDPPWLTLYNRRRATAFASPAPDWRMRPDGVLDVALLPSGL